VSHDKASIAPVPPPNFAKEPDSRYAAYVEHFGTTDCWELDALPPTVIADLIRTEVTGLIDQTAWDEATAGEDRNRALLGRVAAKVEKLLRGRKPLTPGIARACAVAGQSKTSVRYDWLVIGAVDIMVNSRYCRPKTRCTCTALHLPPRVVGIPRSLRPAAMARSDVAPAA
jgi:hypothetical protein